jgi:hypothetical protein
VIGHDRAGSIKNAICVAAGLFHGNVNQRIEEEPVAAT